MKLFAYDGTFLYFRGGDWGVKGSLLLLLLYLALLCFAQAMRRKSLRARREEHPDKKEEDGHESGANASGDAAEPAESPVEPDKPPVKKWNRKIRERVISCLLALLVFPLYWACPATDSDSLAAAIFGGVLRWETPLSCVLMAVIVCEMILIRGDKSRFLGTVNRIVRPMLLVCLYATAASRQVLLSEHHNLPGICVLCVLFVVLGEFDFGTRDAKVRAVGPYAAVEDYNALFAERKREADQLIELIKAAPDDAYSICVNGQWGSGKTSVVNGALSKLKSELPENYEEIRINAIEMDTVQSLLAYVFDQIRQCLKKRGAYVGPGSEYRDVVTGLMKTAGAASAAVWVEKTVFPAAEDFRTQRKRLEDIISNVMGEGGKIVITVDDVERCEEDKARQFIYFTKEVAAMSCCVVVFIADYDYLEGSFRGKNGEVGKALEEYHFFEKYFNYRVDLTTISIYEAMAERSKGKPYLDSSFRYDGYCAPPEEYRNLRERLDKQMKEPDSTKEKSEQSDGAQRLRAAAERFEAMLENPRRMIKVLETLDRYYRAVNDAFRNDAETHPANEVREYFKLIRLHQTLFLLAFISVCFPPEAKELSRKGCAAYFNDCLKRADSGDANAGCICALADKLFFRILASDKQKVLLIDYAEQKVIYFADSLLADPHGLPRLVNTFTQQEVEWLDAIDRGKLDAADENWDEVVKTVLTRLYFHALKDAEAELRKGRERIRTLLSFAADRIRENPESASRYLSFLAFSRQHYRWVDSELPIMKELYQIMGAEDVAKLLPADIGRWLDASSGLYVHSRMKALTGLVLLFEAEDRPERGRDETTVENALELLFIGTNEEATESRLNRYIDRVSRLTNFPGGMPAKKDPFARLNWLLYQSEKLMEQYDMLQYGDNRLMLMRGKAAIEDMWYFDQFCRIAARNNGQTLHRLTEGSVDDAIAAVRRLLHQGERTALDQAFSDFFLRLREEPVILDDGQLRTLQNMVTRYCGSGYQNPSYYRRVLLNCARRREKSAEAAADEGEAASDALLPE